MDKKKNGISIGKLYYPILVCLIVTSSYQFWRSDMTTRNRFVFLLTGLMILGGLFYAVCSRFGRNRKFRYGAAAVLLLLVGWIALDRREPDTEALRAEYVHQMDSYRGTPFVWGGETSFGMDCSGFARTTFWRAMLVEGIRQHNPKLLGPRLWLFWWRDITAKAILDGEYGFAKKIGAAKMLSGFDATSLKVGDLAVTDDGSHVMVYFGNGKWIEASPDDMKVVANSAPMTSKRGYFNVPVVLLRWSALDK